MYQAVKGAFPGTQIRYAVTKFNGKEDPSGIYPAAQLPILMHIEKNRMGIGFANDKNN